MEAEILFFFSFILPILGFYVLLVCLLAAQRTFHTFKSSSLITIKAGSLLFQLTEVFQVQFKLEQLPQIPDMQAFPKT